MTEQVPELLATALNKDPKIAEAKKLLHEALETQQKKINGIKPANPDLKKDYEELLNQIEALRGAKLWYPYLGSGIGKGPFVELLDGSIKLDFITGIGTHYWGHSHLDLLDTGIDAALSDTVMQGHLQQNFDSLELCQLLVKSSKVLDHCFLSTSGAFANENALKIAFQKHSPASRILAFDRCFVGRTWAISQITDKPAFREGLPLNVLVDYVPFYDAKDPQGSTQRAVEMLKKYIARYPKQHALMCFELVQGEGGFHAGTKEFFVALMEILKEHQIAVFADEVQTFGRTTELFAYQHFGLESYIDIASVGKLTQTCATLFRSDYKPLPGLLSQTFTSSTSAIKASYVILNTLLNDGYFGSSGKIAKLHTYFADHLEKLVEKHPHLISGPFGIGSMIAFTPFGGDNKKVSRFAHYLFDEGLMCFVAGGGDATRIRFLIPAGVVTHEHIDLAIKIIEKSLVSFVED